MDVGVREERKGERSRGEEEKRWREKERKRVKRGIAKRKGANKKILTKRENLLLLVKAILSLRLF